MATWVFFNGHWKLIEARRRVWYIVTICVLSAAFGACLGFLPGLYMGSDLTARAYNERLAEIDRKVAELDRRAEELEKAYTPLTKQWGVSKPPQ